MRLEKTSVTNAVNAIPDQVGDIGEIDNPQLVRAGCGEVSFDQIRWPLMRTVRDRVFRTAGRVESLVDRQISSTVQPDILAT